SVRGAQPPRHEAGATMRECHRIVENLAMATKRKIEVFSASCALCHDVIDTVRREAGSSCELVVRDMMDARVLARAEKLGIRSVPAVVVDGKLVPDVDVQTLKDMLT